MEPTRADMRSAIIDAMRGRGPRGEQPNQYARLLNEVVAILAERGFSDGVEYSGPTGGRLTGVAERRFREQVWDLIAAGVLVPGYNQHNAEWPWLSLTEPGEQLLAEEQPTPADPEGYVTRVDQLLPGEEHRVLLYLREAVGAFNRQLYLATTVMLGVASEGLLLRLAEAVAASCDDEEWYVREIEGEFALPQFRAVKSQIKTMSDDLPYTLRESFEAHWQSIHTLLRLERNEAGHPTGVERSRDEAHASLLLFPILAQIVKDFEVWTESSG